MPSVASFMMPACKCVTACPEDKLRSVVDSLVNEKIGCVVVVDTLSRKAVGIITKQDVNRYFLSEVSARNARSLPRPFPSSFDVLSRPAPRKATTKRAPIRPDDGTLPKPLTVRGNSPPSLHKSSRKNFFSSSPPAPPGRRSLWTRQSARS